MNKIYLALLMVVVLGSGAYFYFGMQNSSSKDMEASVSEEKKESPAEAMKENEGTTAPVATDGAMAKAEAKTFEVGAGNFSFSVKEMKVKQGDTVKIVFTNNEGFHDWVIDEFSARTKQLAAGKSETIEFVADKKGTFEYYCSVGAHRAMGMRGNLIVE